MATITLKLRDEIAQQFREFALRETGTMRGLSIVAEKALSEYMNNHRDEMRKQSPITA
jgi:predicted transcriptional regulator